jgi:hypothetical protein
VIGCRRGGARLAFALSNFANMLLISPRLERRGEIILLAVMIEAGLGPE